MDDKNKVRYHPVVGGQTQQTAERYDGRDACEVEEDDGSKALDVESVRDVRQVEGVPRLHVVNQSAKQPGEESLALFLSATSPFR